MKVVFETERLIFRELNILDTVNFYTLNSNPKVLRFTGDKPFLSISDAELFLSNYSEYKLNGYGRWAVISKRSKQFLGWCGLKLNEENEIDLGFRFFESEWGKGYATESARATLKYGFDKLKLESIIGRASIGNIASIKVLEKVGMIYKKSIHCKGMGICRYYSISKNQY